MTWLFGILLLFSFINAGITCDDYYSVKRNCSMCGLNAVCVHASSYAWCVCGENYAGDGMHCTPTSNCTDNTCCPNTYTWNQAGQCCSSTNVCANPSLNHCDPKEKCEPTLDHYLCVGPDRDNSILPDCNGKDCTAGQDCMRDTNGEVLCVDPCQEHRVLNNSWRADNQSTENDLLDDRHIHGWFQFIGPGGSRMPETCTSAFNCGSGSPVSLRGTHPTLAEGIVLRHGVSGKKCGVTNQIYVKACPGNFFVYKLMGLYYPGFGYCTDHNTVVVPQCSPACAPDEDCLWANDSWGCYCKTDATLAPGDSQLGLAVSCSGTQLTLSASRCRLESLGFQTSSIHLTNSTCVGKRGYGGPFSTIGFSSGFSQCGTIITLVNETRISISNVIYLTSKNSLTADNHQVPVSCERTLDMQLSSELYGNADGSCVDVTVPGLGNFTVMLSMFKNSVFTKPYSQNKLVVPRGQNVYIGAFIEDAAVGGPAIAMNNCFATPSSSPQDTNKHFFIQNRCPNVADPSVQMFSLAEHYQTGFKAQLFGESWSSDTMYLHCALGICASMDDSLCASVCPAPTDPASADLTNLLTLGPIRRAELADVTPTVTCDVTGITVSIEQTVVEGLGFNTTTLPKSQETCCIGSLTSGAPGLITIQTPFLNKECGLQFTVTDSVVNISSTLYLAVQKNSEISNLSAGIPFTCTFQLKKFGVSSVDLASRGDVYTAAMSVFSDAAYTIPDLSLQATDFQPGNRLYVNVELVRPKDPLIALVLHACNATITSVQNMTEIQLIASGASVPGHLNTVVTENGDSSKARFYFDVSEAIHASEEFFLSCEVSICVLGNGSCLHVSQRRRRSALERERVNTWIVSHYHSRHIRF